MTKIYWQRATSKRGSATLMALLVVVLLSALGAMMITLSLTESSISTNFRDGIATQYLAEEGVQLALVKLQQDVAFLTTVTNLKPPPYTPNMYTIQSATKNAGTTTSGNYSITVKRVDSSNDRTITAVATVNKAKRQIVIKVTLPGSTPPSPLVIGTWNNH